MQAYCHPYQLCWLVFSSFIFQYLAGSHYCCCSQHKPMLCFVILVWTAPAQEQAWPFLDRYFLIAVSGATDTVIMEYLSRKKSRLMILFQTLYLASLDKTANISADTSNAKVGCSWLLQCTFCFIASRQVRTTNSLSESQIKNFPSSS